MPDARGVLARTGRREDSLSERQDSVALVIAQSETRQITSQDGGRYAVAVNDPCERRCGPMPCFSFKVRQQSCPRHVNSQKQTVYPGPRLCTTVIIKGAPDNPFSLYATLLRQALPVLNALEPRSAPNRSLLTGCVTTHFRRTATPLPKPRISSPSL